MDLPLDIPTIILIFLGAWGIFFAVAKAFDLKRYGCEVGPFIVIWRTKRVNWLLDLLAKKLSKVTSVLADISIALGVGLMGLGAYVLINNLRNFFLAPTQAVPIFPAIPVLTIRESLPFFLASVAVLIIVHEFAHGVVMRHEKIELKSAGVLLLAAIPGGFVEPQEESFKNATRRKRMRVLAAGSSANLVSGLLVVLLMALFFQSNGVLVTDVVKGGPAEQQGILPGSIITSINGITVERVNVFMETMSKVEPGQVLTFAVKFTNGTIADVKVHTGSDPDNPKRAIVGVFLRDAIPNPVLFQGLFWLQFWSINIAVVNMLPLYPLDGAGFLSTFMEGYLGKRTRYVKIGLTVFFLALLGLNFTLTFLRFGILTL